MRPCRRDLPEDRLPFRDACGWGCRDGEHKAWIIIEVDNKEEARRILPPAFCSQAKIVSLNKFSMEEIDDILRQHRR